MRDAVITDAPQRTPEVWIRRFVTQYNKWAVSDGAIKIPFDTLSLFDIVHGARGVSPKLLENRMIQKLKRRAEQWEDALEIQHDFVAKYRSRSPGSAEIECPAVPTLYGIVTSHTIIAFVTYDPSAESPALRTVAIFDFSQEGFDVWNALAVAIFCIHCRNRMIELMEFLPDFEADEEIDPDL